MPHDFNPPPVVASHTTDTTDDRGPLAEAIKRAVADAYARGAREMREAAARCVIEMVKWPSRWDASVTVAEQIRKLPVPEAKL